MRREDVFHRLAGSELLQDQLDSDPGTGNDGLAHHHSGVGE